MAISSVTMKIINDESLIDCLTLYGLSEESRFDEEKEEYFFEGELTYCSKSPHQIVKHASKLVFPDKIREEDINIYIGNEAV